jgi:hypothetical protein
MSSKKHRAQPAASIEPEAYARITRWGISSEASSMHIIGYIEEHGRLIDDAGEPYIGSPLREIDLERRVAVNRSGRMIALVGDPLPPGDLPDDLKQVLGRAERAWRLFGQVKWERLEPTEAEGNGSSHGRGDEDEGSR